MHCILVGFMATIGLCLARPTPEGPALELANTSSGFQVQYLPVDIRPSRYSQPAGIINVKMTMDHSSNSNYSKHLASNLKWPLKPQAHPEFHPQIFYDFGKLSSPRGGELIMSISTSLYYSWIDIAGIPITRSFSERKIPFPAFLYTTRPTLLPAAILNPFKVGIAFCWILRDILRYGSPTWPGYIRADISENNRKVGSVDISNIL